MEMTQEGLARLHREAEAELKKYPGVVGVGYGFRKRGGVTTDQIAFTVYVVEKKSRAELRPEDMLPPDFKGVPTDVIKVPSAVDLHCEDMNHHSPLVGGISISTLKQAPNGGFPTGTLGCFATINGVNPPENVVLLTNNHVLLSFGEHVGDTVYQPKHVEVSGQPSVVLNQDQRNPIGKIHNVGLKGNHPYTFAGEAQAQYALDCATAKLDISISSWCGSNCGVHFKNEIRGLNINGNSVIEDVGKVRQANLTPGTDYVVYKVGRRTGRTVGKVTNVGTVLDDGRTNFIEIEATANNCNNQLQFADDSDSGSVIINADNKIIGLLCAIDTANPKIAFACHIEPVLDKLGIQIITRAHPHTVADTLLDVPGGVVEDGLNHTARLKEKFLRTARGRELYGLVLAHRFEAVELVNHRRPVTVAWHRSKGPAFLAHVLNNARDPAHAVPAEVEGVPRAALLSNMARALATYGSPELQAVVARYLDEALAQADGCASLHELAERFPVLRSA